MPFMSRRNGFGGLSGLGAGAGSSLPPPEPTAYEQLVEALGDVGGWFWDFTDQSMLFQDAAGTTPVAALDDPVGRANDLVADLPVQQATASNRPLWKQGAGILFDGSDDILLTPSTIDLRSFSQVTFVVGARKLSDAAPNSLVEHGVGPASPRLTGILFPRANNFTGASMTIRDGTNLPETRGPASSAPASRVLSGEGDYTQSTVATQTRLYTNGATTSNTTANSAISPPGGAFGNYALSIGRRADTSLPFNGYVTGVVLFPYIDADTRQLAELVIGQLNQGLPT